MSDITAWKYVQHFFSTYLCFLCGNYACELQAQIKLVNMMIGLEFEVSSFHQSNG